MREARGMTQADLCRASGVSSSQLAQYESGKRDVPRERAIDLVIALRGSLDYLFLGRIDTFPADLANAILNRRRTA
jgi:transcriptional regulator with XRE-family HTH domain